MSEREIKSFIGVERPKISAEPDGGLNAYFSTLKSGEITQVERNSIDVLIKCARACSDIFKQLHTTNTSQVKKYAGERLSDAYAVDTYEAHGARVAKNVVELGVLDPLTFCIAFLHDLGGKKVMPFAANKIRTYLEDVLQDQELIEAVIAGVRAFDTQDHRSQTATNQIACQNYKGIPFGENFSPNQYASLQEKVIKNHTNGIEDIGVVRKNGLPVIELREGREDPTKFPSITKVLKSATDVQRNAPYNGIPLQESTQKRIQYSVHTAYLAAAMDNINNPKKGTTLADRQKIALGIQYAHLPIYWAMGDAPAHAAEEIIYKAFFPEAYSAMTDAWSEIQAEQNGHFIESQKAIYQRFVDEQIIGRIEERNPNLRRVSESEMAHNEEQFRRKSLPEIQAKNLNILQGNEIYVAPIDIKTPPGIFRKGLSLNLIHHSFKGFQGKRMFKDKVARHRFTSKNFWKNYIRESYDQIRTRIVMGDEVLKNAAAVFDEIREFKIIDPDSEQYETVEDTQMSSAWGKNCARVPFIVNSAKQRKEELVEDKNPMDDSRTSVRHYVIRPPITGLDLNLELHESGGLAYLLWYIGQSRISHLNYKLTKQIAEMARASNLDDDRKNLLNEYISEALSHFKHDYVSQTPVLGSQLNMGQGDD